MTNLDVSSPDKAIAAEHWYRHRTTVENIFRDSLQRQIAADQQAHQRTAWLKQRSGVVGDHHW